MNWELFAQLMVLHLDPVSESVVYLRMTEPN